jgi:hypothetical protein
MTNLKTWLAKKEDEKDIFGFGTSIVLAVSVYALVQCALILLSFFGAQTPKNLENLIMVSIFIVFRGGITTGIAAITLLFYVQKWRDNRTLHNTSIVFILFNTISTVALVSIIEMTFSLTPGEINPFDAVSLHIYEVILFVHLAFYAFTLTVIATRNRKAITAFAQKINTNKLKQICIRHNK